MKKVLVLAAVAALSVPAIASAETQVIRLAPGEQECFDLPDGELIVQVATRHHHALIKWPNSPQPGELAHSERLGKRLLVTVGWRDFDPHQQFFCAVLDASAKHGRVLYVTY
jgi:hypothetical protein